MFAAGNTDQIDKQNSLPLSSYWEFLFFLCLRERERERERERGEELSWQKKRPKEPQRHKCEIRKSFS
jgi:hypothetical protein